MPAAVRRSSHAAPLVALLAALAIAPAPALGQASLPSGFQDRLVVGGLSLPSGMAFLPDGRLLVIEQLSASVLVLPFPDHTPATEIGRVFPVATGNERGLLGIAVDPRWPNFPYLYFHHTAIGSRVTIARYRCTGDVAGIGDGSLILDIQSRYELIDDAPDLRSNHNGGTVRFGWDDMLYASFGEDGFPCGAQDSVSLRGVILRMDVKRLPDGPGRAPRELITPPDNPFAAHPDSNARLVWAYGLRNPFRFQADTVLHELIVADVGQVVWEELDRIGAGGQDFGWPMREGPAAYPESCPTVVPTLIEPIFSYNRSQVLGAAAIITSGAYRPHASSPNRLPDEYTGNIFVNDYYAGYVWRLVGSGDSWSVAPPVPGQVHAAHWAEGLENVSDYAVGYDGELFYCRQAVPGTASGQIRRIFPVTPSPPDTTDPTPPPIVSAAYPQPSDGAVRFDLTLAAPARVALSIHDATGRLVRELGPVDRTAGPFTPVWDARDEAGNLVESGIYFARVDFGSDHVDRRVVVVR